MNYAVILAGGRGVRFNSVNIPKQFVELTGMPILVYSMKTAQMNRNIDEICVVTLEEYIPQVRAWGEQYHISKLKYITKSGKMRFDSVYNGLCAIPAAETDTVIIMTAVCPLLSQETIDKHYACIEQHGPQTYHYGVLKRAHELYRNTPQAKEVYEDSELVLRTDAPVTMVQGDRFCIKVTYPEDLAIARALYPLFCEKENRRE